MRIYLDLRSVLPDGIRLPQLAEGIGITVNELRHLMKVGATTINQAHLNKVCSFLIREKLVHESDLPEILFSKSYCRFWDLLSDRRRIALATGFRRDEKDGMEVVSAADNILHCNLLYELTHDSPQGRHSRRSLPRQAIDAQLVEAWDFDGTNHDAVIRGSRRLYKAFQRKSEDRGWVLFGSMKINPLVDYSFANCFQGAKAFEPELVVQPGDRSCPVMLRYRAKDPTPPSCFGGVQLSETQPGEEPGLYYEAELGKDWVHIPSNDLTDSALVFYRFDRGHGKWLEMVLGGFSGRATRQLADYLRNGDVDSFWPPIISDRDLDVGVFVVKFSFRPPRKGGGSRSNNEIAKAEVIPLAKEVLAQRVKPAKRSGRKLASSSTRKSAPK
jgi:hypothetical protein